MRPKSEVKGEIFVRDLSELEFADLAAAQQAALSLPYQERKTFLSGLVMPHQSPTHHPKWLLHGTKYDSNVWCVGFDGINGRSKNIDFNVRLEDGKLLTAPEHRALLKTFKRWIYVQVQPQFSGGRALAPVSAMRRVNITLYLIDGLLLRAHEFKLSEYELALVTKDDFISLVLSACSSSVAEHVYGYSRRIGEFLLKQIDQARDDDIANRLKQCPALGHVTDDAGADLKLTDAQLVRARAFLFNEGVLGAHDRFVSTYFKEILFANTLHGRSLNVSAPCGLRVKSRKYRTEYPAVPVTTGVDTGIEMSSLRDCLSSLRRLTLAVNEPGLSTCETGYLYDLTAESVLEGERQRITGRIRTLPGNMAFKLLRSCIEFTLTYSAVILDTVFAVLSSLSVASSTETPRLEMIRQSAERSIPSRLREIGVNGWAIEKWGPQKPTTFSELRASPGLYEIYRVLCGAIQIIVGATMARRQVELLELPSEGCLIPNTDPDSVIGRQTDYFLIFKIGKSGSGKDRETEALPILLLGARLVRKLQDFNVRCIKAGVIAESPSLFQSIEKFSGRLKSINRDDYDRNFDYVCDYFETSVVKWGDGSHRRYYVRQHQLRRFFAMAFFWSSSYAGLDTLRYFLGHTDLEHLYHYITENFAGRLLREVSAVKLAESLRSEGNDVENIETLRALLKERFGTDHIHLNDPKEIDEDLGFLFAANAITSIPDYSDFIKSNDDLENRIFSLLESGIVELHPEFFRVKDQNSNIRQDFRLILKVRGTDYVK